MPSRHHSLSFGRMKARANATRARSGSGAGVRDSSPSPSGPRRRSNVLIAPGLLFGAKQYSGMRQHLLDLGHPRVETVPVSTMDWLPSLLLGEPFTWFLDRMEGLASELSTEGDLVSVVGHSAGGWIARIYLAPVAYNGRQYAGERGVGSLVTLGTPHLSCEEYPFGRVKERRRGEEAEGMSEAARGSSLVFANEVCGLPACGVSCVAGRLAEGRGGPLARALARASYAATCRDRDAAGDGVCPVESCLLPGRVRELVLDGVHHGPGPRNRIWYGSREVVEQWDAFLP